MTTIEEDYVSFETAKLLKEKGFEGYSIITIYDGNAASAYFKELQEKHLPYSSDDPKLKEFYYTRPTLQMAIKWLRKVHNIHIELNWDKGNQLYNFNIWKPGKYQPEISSLDLWRIYKDYNYPGEWNYEEAAEEAIQYSLKNLI